jgi:hypothetical protein
VPVDDIDLEALTKLDVKQLWAEIHELVQNEGLQSFRLSKDEQRQLNVRNTQHLKPIRAQHEIEDILTHATNNPQYKSKLITITDWKEGFPELNRYSASEIGKALALFGIQSELKSIDGKKGRFHNLPVHSFAGPPEQKERVGSNPLLPPE